MQRILPFLFTALLVSATLLMAATLAIVDCAAADNAAELSVSEFDPTKVLRVATVWPKLQETNRPWVDHTGRNAVVAKLAGRQGDKIVFRRADGQRILADPQSLSLSDRTYAIQHTEKRVNELATVIIGKIVTVRDGDTIQIETLEKKKFNVRLDGIDAPEKRQDFGKTATDWLARLINQTVRVEFVQEDRYQRILGDIYIGDRWVNYELALAGMAWHYSRYNEDSQLAGAHAYAKSLKRGLWQQDEFIAPWDYRNGVRKKTLEPMNVESIRDTDTVVFVTGSGHSFHTKDCHHVRENGIPMPLSRAVSAYEPCEICKPPLTGPDETRTE